MSKKKDINIRPTLNRLFVKLVQESDKFADKIYKPNVDLTTEPYCDIIAVGEQVKSIKPGEIGLMRTGTGAEVFELYGDKYAIITEMDIVSILPLDIIEEFKKNIKRTKPNLAD